MGLGYPTKDLPAKILWEEEPQRSEVSLCVSKGFKAEFAVTRLGSRRSW
ncbi:MAG: hypothetical protein ACI4MQ_05095 [Candidatus Coproplasma sp.]